MAIKLLDSLQAQGVDFNKITDESTREEVISLFKALDPVLEQRIQDEAEERVKALSENDAEMARMRMGLPRRKMRDTDRAFRRMVDIWRNNGYDPEKPHVQYRYEHFVQADERRQRDAASGKLQKSDYVDTQFSTDQPILIPRVVAEFVREAIEPNIVLTGLLQNISFQNGTHVTFPAMSAMQANDIAEGGEYPEQRLEFAGEVTTKIGKSGIAIKMTEEMIRYSQWDIMRMHLSAAGRALIRWKEQKAQDLITTQGITYYDNTGVFGTDRYTTGRDSRGVYNGTIHIQDLFSMFADMGNSGFVPDTLIMNPYGWYIFAVDPNLRNYGFTHGTQMFNPYNGTPGSAPQWGVGGLHRATQVDDPTSVATTFVPPPSQFFPIPFRIVISPFIPYNATLNTTDIIMCDSRELGVLITDEQPVTEEWKDPARDIHKVKIRERYAMALLNEGQATRQAKNVLIGRSYAIEDLLVWEASAGAVLPTEEDATGLGNLPIS